MNGKSPLDVWSRCVRRCIRDWARDHGQVPPLFGAVSVRANPRRVQAMMRLDLLPDRAAVDEQLRELVARHDPVFAAYGGVVPSGSRLVVVAFDRTLTDAWEASVSPDGIGGWDRASVGEVAVAPAFLQEALRA